MKLLILIGLLLAINAMNLSVKGKGDIGQDAGKGKQATLIAELDQTEIMTKGGGKLTKQDGGKGDGKGPRPILEDAPVLILDGGKGKTPDQITQEPAKDCDTTQEPAKDEDYLIQQNPDQCGKGGVDQDDNDDQDEDYITTAFMNEAKMQEQDKVSQLLIQAKQADGIDKVNIHPLVARIRNHVNKLLKETPAEQWHEDKLGDRLDAETKDIKDNGDKNTVKQAVQQLIKHAPLTGEWNQEALQEAIMDHIQM